ncbi:toprim domain-containing protein [Mucilaginibacter sp.]|uniref:toprim domain-containing protein n=1 Tax=Mucilaginibacter sp. TaxID=1882438 RepID=UPI0035BBE457
MNINQAKNIPIEKLVEELGGAYAKTDNKGDKWYFSPFRPDEKTPSFKINVKQNTWHDFGLSGTFAHQKQNSGGDILDLWCEYHMKDRRTAIREALQALSEWAPISNNSPRLQTQPRKQSEIVRDQTPRYSILKIADLITFAGLKDELERRRISLKVANLYLKQGYILDTVTNKKYNGFLFENDKGGYEVSIPNPVKQECFKTCIGPKATSRILTNSNETNSADVFEGFWDFLSWLEIKAVLRPINHAYILNSTSLVKEACEKIISFKETVKYAFLFMDNDEAGYQATHAIAEQLEDFKVGSFEYFYEGYKDLNEFWIEGKISDYPYDI